MVAKIESVGFKQDGLSNTLRSDSASYHASLSSSAEIDSGDLWSELENILRSDIYFVGALEEEMYFRAHAIALTGQSRLAPIMCGPLIGSQPPAGKFKSCDIHINIDLAATSASALAYIESLQIASYTKVVLGRSHRVFSATCESLESGRKLFDVLGVYLTQVPDLVGVMKFEHTTRYLRIPDNAPTLPLTYDANLADWLLSSSAGGAPFDTQGT